MQTLLLRRVLVCAALMWTCSSFAKELHVVVDRMTFTPEELHANVGDVVVWLNQEDLLHSATAHGSWDMALKPHSRKRLMLRQGGTFDYVCKYHPNMRGRIVVAGKEK